MSKVVFKASDNQNKEAGHALMKNGRFIYDIL